METKKAIKVFVVPRVAIEGGTVDDDTMVISIGSPGVGNPVIHGRHVYEFQFHDVKEEYWLEKANMMIRPMEYEIAERIAEIAVEHRDKPTWIIHCEAGISRSPGVALGLSRYIELDPGTHMLQKMFPCYNSYVRKYIEKALRERLQMIGEINL
jgi:predicted protein tyrosine phosphatase